MTPVFPNSTQASNPTLRDVDSIMSSNKKSTEEKKVAFGELLKIAPKIHIIRSFHIQIPTQPIDENPVYRFNICNPSIIKTKEGYICTVRSVSYQYGKSGGRDAFWIDPNCPKNINPNSIITLGKDFRLIKIKPIDDSMFSSDSYNGVAKGIFDIRVYHSSPDGSRLQFMASSHEYSPYKLSQMVYGELHEEEDVYKCTKLVSIMGPDIHRHEKNWMPFKKKGKLYAYYSYNPLTICAINRKSGAISIEKSPLLPYDFSKFCGSAPPIHFKGGSLVLIHEKGICNNDQYCLYVHRFLWISKKGIIEKISHPFVFMQKGIEFCCGMRIDHSKKNLVFSYGIDDKKAMISMVPIKIVQSMLFKI